MKLPDFLTHGGLNALRLRMGATRLGDLRLAESENRLTIADLEQLAGRGIDVASLDDVRVLGDGTLAYKDRRVILYIRDRMPFNGSNGFQKDLPKYQVVNCRTLEQMRAMNRIDRYVVAIRDDGRFSVNFLGDSSRTPDDIALPVCQNCLDRLTWEGFTYSWPKPKREIHVARFAPKAFFEVFPVALLDDAEFETEAGAPLNDYTGHFSEVAAKLKATVHFCCEQCGADLSDERLRPFLHAHHVSGRRYDNRRENLRALCLECHALQPGHGHMAQTEDLEAYRLARREVAAS